MAAVEPVVVKDIEIADGLTLRGAAVYRGARLAQTDDVALRHDLPDGHPLRDTRVLRCTTIGCDAIVVDGKQIPVNPSNGEPIDAAPKELEI
jgi:hypothetical protein